MKKLISLLLCAVLCISMLMPALAETGATLLYTLDGRYDTVQDTSMLKYNGTFTKLDGTPITENCYGIPSVQRGWIVVDDYTIESVNKYGMLDSEGNLVIPCQYIELRTQNKNWVVGIKATDGTSDNYDFALRGKTEFYLIDSVDVYNMTNGKMFTLTRDQYKAAYADTDWVNINIETRSGMILAYDADFEMIGKGLNGIYDDEYAIRPLSVIRQNGKEGLQNSIGRIVLPIEYDDLDNSRIYDGYIPAKVGAGWGMIRTDGTVVVPFAYEDVISVGTLPWNKNSGSFCFNFFGYFCVEKNDCVGFVDVNGNETVMTSYDRWDVDLCGASLVVTNKTGGFTIIAADGKETTLMSYRSMHVLPGSGGMYHVVRNASNRYGLIDWHGNVILQPQYDDIRSGDGQHAVCIANGKSEVYQLTYPAPVLRPEDMPAEVPVEAPAEVPAAQNDDAQPAAGTGLTVIDVNINTGAASSEHPAVPLLNSAIVLLSTDPATNASSVSALLAISMAHVGGTNPGALTLLESAATLLAVDPAANAASIIALLNTVIGML